MIKSLKYRLYPTKKQRRLLQETLDECRWLYNHFLEERKTSWENEKRSVTYFEQAISIVKLKQERQSLTTVYSQTLQNVAERVDKAFQNFFHRVKAGNGPVGYPRFKSFDRYDSFTYTQYGFELENTDNRLKLSKIGSIKIKVHRPIFGTIKNCTIVRHGDKWYASFVINYEPTLLPKSKAAIGIDVGLENFATFSNGHKIDNPRFFKKGQKGLAKAQRKVNKYTKGTPKRKKAKKVVAHIHRKITNRRHNFVHQETRKIINEFGIICIEKLDVKNMIGNHTNVFGHKLNKNIADASWAQFATTLSYKAEEAGRQFIAVNPRYTSQRCSQCGTMVKKELSERWHNCPVCGCHLHRDYNASLNILALGLQSLGIVPKSYRIYSVE